MATPPPSRWRGSAVLLAVLAVAAALRLTDLAARPMHADEAVHADKLGTLLEGGRYAYDPVEFHGPTLYYLTLPAAWLRGAHRYLELDEPTLRSVPAAFGLALVAAALAARRVLGRTAALLAAGFAAISPAMVYYSRYYIHETLLVAFSFGALAAGWRYLARPAAGPAAAAGAFAGLMLATKETAGLALASMVLALAATDLADGWRGRSRGATPPGGGADAPLPLHRLVQGRHVLVALAAGLAVAAALFSSFLAHPEGLLDAVRAYAVYFERASAASWHIHPWDYYLRLLILFPADGTPVWSEGLLLALASLGGLAGWLKGAAALPGADRRLVRFLAFYTLLLLLVYAAIPYKTPWCLLGFLHGMTLLAGAGAVLAWRAARRAGPAARTSLAALLALASAHLCWQAWNGSFRFAADPRNPYVYAHTGNDVLLVADRLRALSRVHPLGSAMPVQVISGRENLWPLPWYLRAMSGVAWWTGVPQDPTPSAPVILLTPDMEPALVRKLYDLPPPGERELYFSVFERPVELRPGVELRGYAAGGLWQELRRREAQAQP